MKILYLLIMTILLFSIANAQTEEVFDRSTLSGKWLGNKAKIREGSCDIYGQPFIDMPTIIEIEVDKFGFANFKEYNFYETWNIINIAVADIDEHNVITFSEIKVVKCGTDTRLNQLSMKGIFKENEGKWLLEMEGIDNTCPDWNCKYKVMYQLMKEESLQNQK